MKVIDRIHNCKNDEQLYWLTRRLIKDAVKDAKCNNINKGTIGSKLEINPTDYHLENCFEDCYRFTIQTWNGYIPKGTKIVYGSIFNEYNNTVCCGGNYYYLDDESYVYEFIKYIKKYKVKDIFDVVWVINKYIMELFENDINPAKKEDIHKLLYKDSRTPIFFNPTKEHSIKDFYGNGGAECSEYSVVANNLFSVLNIPITLLVDEEGEHVFNLLYLENEESEEGYDFYIIDYCLFVDMFDENFNFKGSLPFFKKIDNGSFELIDRVIKDGLRIVFNDYFVYCINGKQYKYDLDGERHYGIKKGIIESKKLALTNKGKAKIVL